MDHRQEHLNQLNKFAEQQTAEMRVGPPTVDNEWEARRKRQTLETKLTITVQALMAHGTDEDYAAAISALGKVAAKAMRRR